MRKNSSFSDSILGKHIFIFYNMGISLLSWLLLPLILVKAQMPTSRHKIFSIWINLRPINLVYPSTRNEFMKTACLLYCRPTAGEHSSVSKEKFLFPQDCSYRLLLSGGNKDVLGSFIFHLYQFPWVTPYKYQIEAHCACYSKYLQNKSPTVPFQLDWPS